MSGHGDNIHIPIPEDDALRLLLQVKPTARMPRPSDGKKPPKTTERRDDERTPRKRRRSGR